MSTSFVLSVNGTGAQPWNMPIGNVSAPVPPRLIQMSDSIEAVTPQSLPQNFKSFQPQTVSQHRRNTDTSWYELFHKPLFDSCTITAGRLAGAISLLWYNSWDDLQLIFSGQKSLNSLRLYLPDYFIKYVYHVVSLSEISAQVATIAMIYVARFRMRTNIGVQSAYTSEARIFIASLMTANKFDDDVSFTTKTWATVGNIDVSELKRMETEFLGKIDFKLHITSDEWAQYNEFISHFVFPLVDQMALR